MRLHRLLFAPLLLATMFSALPVALLGAAAPKAPAPARPAITGIAYVRFAVEDQAAEAAFFEKLGYRALHPDAGPNVSMYYLDAALRQHIETVVAPPVQTAGGPSRLLAVGLQTSSVTQMQKYLAAKGVTGDTLRDHVLVVHDPEGNVLEFTDAVPVSGAEGVLRATLDYNAVSHRIIHAGFVVQSEQKQNAFYRGILGFRSYWHGGMKEDVTDWSSVQVPDGTDWIEYMLRLKPDADAETRGVLNHVSLGVVKMDAVVAKLKENGCDTKACTASQMGRDGKVQLNLYDPEHTRVEVMEFKPTGTTCCSEYTGRMPSPTDPL